MPNYQSVAFHTLGCKLNYSETSTLSRMLEADGFEKKDFNDIADIYVINTCSVTENADKECRHLVRRIMRRSPASLVVVTGCYAQLKPQQIASIKGVDLVLGAAEKFNITKHLQLLSKGAPAQIHSCDIDAVTDFHASHSQNGRTRTFLKVQDGCDYNCTFCTIPLARGHSRSDSVAHVVEQVQQLAEQGVNEIVLTGVNLGDFRDNDNDFFSLIQALDKITGIERFRISSIEPNLLTEDIIRFVASSRSFMPHFHIPLQSGNNRILGLMRRRYKRELYAERVEMIKRRIPHCCIGVDVIVGFPSENDEDFRDTFNFIQQMDISYLHVFTYSERAHTLALDINPIVPIDKRHERNKMLRNLSYQKMQYFTEQHYGQTRKVLFEQADANGMMEGYTDNYIKVQTPYRPEWVNQIVDWELV